MTVLKLYCDCTPNLLRTYCDPTPTLRGTNAEPTRIHTWTICRGYLDYMVPYQDLYPTVRRGYGNPPGYLLSLRPFASSRLRGRFLPEKSAATMGLLWTDYGRTMGLLWANLGRTLDEPWARYGLTLG